LLKEGCACVAACCTVRHFQCRWLLCSCGVLDGPIDFAKNCNVSLPREGCARVVACCTVHPPRCRRLLRSCGILDDPINFVRCLAHRSLWRRLRQSRANFNVSWLNCDGALICGTWFFEELVCLSFCWPMGVAEGLPKHYHVA
jgi:hypothetical protein